LQWKPKKKQKKHKSAYLLQPGINSPLPASTLDTDYTIQYMGKTVRSSDVPIPILQKLREIEKKQEEYHRDLAEKIERERIVKIESKVLAPEEQEKLDAFVNAIKI
jgi:hypothetical protein